MSEEYTGAEAPTYPWGRGEIPPDALASPPDLPRFGVVPPGAGRPLTHGSLAPTGGGDFGSSRQGTSNRGGSAYDGAPRTQYVEPNRRAMNYYSPAQNDYNSRPMMHPGTPQYPPSPYRQSPLVPTPYRATTDVHTTLMSEYGSNAGVHPSSSSYVPYDPHLPRYPPPLHHQMQTAPLHSTPTPSQIFGREGSG
jgi:hypothetical protein